MVRKDGAFIKKQRLDEIAKAIAQTFPNGIEASKLAKRLEFDIGLREDTASRYIETIINAKGWNLVDGVIKAE